MVRNYIKKYKLIFSLDKEEIIELKNKYKYFIDCLDIGGIIDNYILSPNELVCILCNTKFNSVYLIQDNNKENKEGKNNNIYPNIINGQNKTKNLDNNDIKTNNIFNKSCNHLIMIKNIEINDYLKD